MNEFFTSHNLTIFDSRDDRYRHPFGAVAEGTNIHFRICLPRGIECSRAQLVIHDEFAPKGSEDTYHDMFWCGLEGGDAEWWEIDYAPEKSTLAYYWFAVDTNAGKLFVSKTWAGKGLIAHSPSAWQLTVYAADFVTPDWLDGGIIYQIFPDSFCKSGEEHDNVPDDRTMHAWGEQPHWQPDANGVYTNRHYFGGDLKGIISRLDYLKSLSVTAIYLNPIFEAHENHRYNTADYTRIDPLLGTDDDFRLLCREAEKRGMRLILDGVFSHTGADSIYFNKNGRYKSIGAYNSTDSPYYSWYKFNHWPDNYSSWWGFVSLPELIEDSPGVMSYMTDDGGIIQRWLGEGACGWRLDVADELPDDFLDALRTAAKKQDPDAVIIGEVWEDASCKVAYSFRRRYLLGRQLDSVMNYCFKDAILGFLHGEDGGSVMDRIMTILEHYPPQVTRLLMNLIGTHDTERILTSLAGEHSGGNGREWQACHHLSEEQRNWGRKRYMLAIILQYTLPGVPSVYYGDEAGMEGYRDPFNRGCYPWGHEDTMLIGWHRALGHLRASLDCFTGVGFLPIEAHGSVIAYLRFGEKDTLLVAVNSGDYECSIVVQEELQEAVCLLGSYDGGRYLVLPPCSAAILCVKHSDLLITDKDYLARRNGGSTAV